MQKAYLSVPKEFDYQECHRFLARSPKECLHDTSDGKISKLLPINNQLVFFQIQSTTKGKLLLTFPQGAIDEKTKTFCKKYVIDWLDLERDLSIFYRLGKKDAILKPLVKRFYGLRLIGIPDLFEALSWAIIGQQINLAFAYSLKQRLVENYGQKSIQNQKAYFIFPEPKVIASLTVADLRPLQFSQRKAEYLIDLAGLMHRGELSKKALSQVDVETAKKQLTDIRGIGNWTANYVVMKCLRHPDAFPLEDAGLHNALKKQLNRTAKPSLSEIQTLAENWKGWRAYATFYLWQSLLE